MKLFLVSLTVWKHNLHDFLTINAIKKLYSLVLEQSMIDNIVENILKIDEAGTKCLEEFETRMMSKQVKAFLDPINKSFKHLKGKAN